jgi:endonuclease YncB( thermonuclease family)
MLALIGTSIFLMARADVVATDVNQSNSFTQAPISVEPSQPQAQPSLPAVINVTPGEPLIGPFTIARVLSADTYDVMDSEYQVRRVRLIGIDAPSGDDIAGKQQCGAEDALISANYAFSYPNIQIMLEPDSSWPKADELGNEYFYFWVDEELFTLDLLEDGNAVEYAKHGQYRHQEAHLAAQAEAKGLAGAGSLQGIWANCPESAGAEAGFGVASNDDDSNLVIIPFIVGDREVNYECHPSYVGICLSPNGGDYNCGSMPIIVIGPDVFRMDGDNDGLACER